MADNICLSDPPRRFGLIDGRAQRRRAAEVSWAGSVATTSIPRSRVKDLPLSRRQLVEIAKALALRPRLLILDEATSALTAADVERVFRLLHELRREGLALLYISHRMHEIAALADTCSVFRNGRHVETFAHGTRTDQEIVRMMIGRDITQVYPPKPAATASRGALPGGGRPGLGRPAGATRPSRSARARSSAWAGSTARASAS